MDIPILKGATAPAAQPMIEVCRSYARKINLEFYGGNKFENAEFFASRKMQCTREDAGWVSQEIYEECVAEVVEAMRLFVEGLRARRGARIAAQEERRAS